ncbi:MAG: hypothetical protein D6809_05210 [Gammaproteobacteria bacterium]|nr:MAG: hypothetical protein D6809_05210 [Gammaproteobacteria bacterium]
MTEHRAEHETDRDALAEELSALVDGELPAERQGAVLAALEGRPELQRRWLHYHLISEALRRNLPERLDPAFGRRLAEAVGREPLLEPSALQPSPQSASQPSSPRAAPAVPSSAPGASAEGSRAGGPGGAPSAPSPWRWGAGLALAASVAALAVVGLYRAPGPERPAPAGGPSFTASRTPASGPSSRP